MASSKRERELARMRAERQAARRAAADAERRRQRGRVLSVLAALVVLGIVASVFLLTRSDKTKNNVASPQPTTSATATPTTSATAAAGPCSYTSSGKASKAVKGTPPAAGLRKVVTAAVKTNRGALQLKLDGTKAPCAVGSFAFLASQKYFDGTPCHRLTTSGIFVLQCGDPTGTGTGGPGYQFADENLAGAKYPRGTVAMANGGAGTNGSQFFLVYKDTQLPPSYTPVGTITQGLPVVEQIAAGGDDGSGGSGPGDGKPKIPVTIQTFTVSGS